MDRALIQAVMIQYGSVHTAKDIQKMCDALEIECRCYDTYENHVDLSNLDWYAEYAVQAFLQWFETLADGRLKLKSIPTARDMTTLESYYNFAFLKLQRSGKRKKGEKQYELQKNNVQCVMKQILDSLETRSRQPRK